MKRIYRIYTLFILIAASLLLNACKQTSEGTDRALRLASPSSEAVGPYLTQDNNGNPVLCWTEKGAEDSLYRLRYAIYDSQSHRFNQAIDVQGSIGSSSTTESMGKIAFKDDGTVLAVFAKSFKNEPNKYAGAIYYVMSKDGGSHWSNPRYLHSDTLHMYGRSFFDITKMADGEIGAIWLDGRFGKTEEGSALFFARTEEESGFGKDTCLDRNTCECCRTEILSSDDGVIHLAYRGIQFPSGPLGKQVRDMVYSSSSDNGKSFTPSRRISRDHWEIEGCPHTGPTLATTKNAVNACWFTGGGVPGLYISTLTDSNVDFKKRKLISESGRHPQMVSIENKLALVWEEPVNAKGIQQKKASLHENMNMDHGNMDMDMNLEEMGMDHTSSTSSQIILTIADRNGKVDKQLAITKEKYAADHAVIAHVDDGLLMAWVQEEREGGSGIHYSFRKID